MKKRMIAAKSFRYGTRMMQAGDVFDVGNRDARVLHAIGRANFYATREAAVVAPMPEPIPVSEIDALRDKARSVGIKADARWSAATLERKIEEAGGAS